jgi:hypothetical protein
MYNYFCLFKVYWQLPHHDVVVVGCFLNGRSFYCVRRDIIRNNSFLLSGKWNEVDILVLPLNPCLWTRMCERKNNCVILMSNSACNIFHLCERMLEVHLCIVQCPMHEHWLYSVPCMSIQCPMHVNTVSHAW